MNTLLSIVFAPKRKQCTHNLGKDPCRYGANNCIKHDSQFQIYHEPRLLTVYKLAAFVLQSFTLLLRALPSVHARLYADTNARGQLSIDCSSWLHVLGHGQRSLGIC